MLDLILLMGANATYKNTQTGEQYRVLWGNKNILVVIKLGNPNAMPEELLVGDLRQGLSTKLYEFIDEPYSNLASESYLSKYNESLEKNWNLIKELVIKEPAIYDKKQRSTMIAEVSAGSATTKRNIKRLLTRYWQRGMEKEALLPDYKNSGAKGVERTISSHKRGRPASYANHGKNVDEYDKASIEKAIKKYYLQREQDVTLATTYKRMIADSYRGKSGTSGIDETYPSIQQFRYWVRKLFTPEQIERARLGNSRFEKDKRELMTSSIAESVAPGQRYQIDSTKGDVHLVSSRNPNKLVGRPEIIFVTDVYSRMIVGVSVSLENESQWTIQDALMNTVEDKVEFAKKFGVAIEEGDWPSHFLPSILLSDNGAMLSKNLSRFISKFRIEIENHSPYRPDYKGVVERSFGKINQANREHLPGAVQSRSGNRGEVDPRERAQMTLYDYTKFVILNIIKFNRTPIAGYPITPEQIDDGVLPTPKALWEWGIVNVGGLPRQASMETVRMMLMKTGSATVTGKGVKFNGLYYKEPVRTDSGIYSGARRKSFKVQVAYDDRLVDEIYLIKESGTMTTLRLVEMDQNNYKGYSFAEVKSYKKKADKMLKEAIHDGLSDDLKYLDQVNDIVATAHEEYLSEKEPNLTKTARKSQMKLNRRVEAKENRIAKRGIAVDSESESNVIHMGDLNRTKRTKPSISEMKRTGEIKPKEDSDD